MNHSDCQANQAWSQLRITRLSNSSWFRIASESLVVHIDPGYTGYFENQGIPEDELKQDADLVLVTHPHKDHLQPLALDKILQPNTRILAPALCAEAINRDFQTIQPGDSLTMNGLNILATYAYNTSEGHSTRKVHHRGDFVGYVLVIANRVIYHAGDTDLIPEMRTLPKVDISLLPIGGTFVMDIGEAAEAVDLILPKVVIPMHQARSDADAFRQLVIQKSPINVILLCVGESITF